MTLGPQKVRWFLEDAYFDKSNSPQRNSLSFQVTVHTSVVFCDIHIINQLPTYANARINDYDMHTFMNKYKWTFVK